MNDKKLQQLKDDLLHTGRYAKQFETIEIIGKGGFGTVLKVMDRLEEQIYAVKKVRLHLPRCDDLRQELKNHKMYREVRALAGNNSQELKHTVRYFNSWLEDLTEEERQEESDRLFKYSSRKRLSSINENESRDNSRQSSVRSKASCEKKGEVDEQSHESQDEFGLSENEDQDFS